MDPALEGILGPAEVKLWAAGDEAEAALSEMVAGVGCCVGPGVGARLVLEALWKTLKNFETKPPSQSQKAQ